MYFQEGGRKHRTISDPFEHPLDAASYPSLRSLEIGTDLNRRFIQESETIDDPPSDSVTDTSYSRIVSSQLYTSCNDLRPNSVSVSCSLIVFDTIDVEEDADYHSCTGAKRIWLRAYKDDTVVDYYF